MEPDEVADILDWDLVVKIGEEKGTRRIHRLFYSQDDYQCFVAIQDEKTKTVVTILPVDYYETLAWKIPRSSLGEAERLVSSQPEKANKQTVAALSDSTKEAIPKLPSSFKISGTLINVHLKPRTMNLGSWPAAAYAGSIAKLLQDVQFFQQIQSRLTPKKQPDEYLVGLAIRLGKNGEIVWVDMEDDGLAQISPSLQT
jgi:hypothetical protein